MGTGTVTMGVGDPPGREFEELASSSCPEGTQYFAEIFRASPWR